MPRAGDDVTCWTGGQIFVVVYFTARMWQESVLPGQAGLPTLDDYWGQPKIVETVRLRPSRSSAR